ncbi:oligosaccharide flippase family protein [Arthrobacter sp. NPDC089319]|uniref:oligosaccharide flippase family protein n=1 Tax=Arthrobacter sp. NPDC089319 TaxID=3155915 RepID=UPI0034448C67
MTARVWEKYRKVRGQQTGGERGLAGRIRHGVAWSTLNAIVMRIGSFLVGIVLARLLAPEQFGIFAVALTVQTVLMAMADLGLSADLIRSPNLRERAPTVATLGLVTGAGLTLLMSVSGQGIADLMGSPAAGPVISVMSLSLLLAGLGVVPYSALLRRFEQKKLFAIGATDFVVGTVLTLAMVLSGWGVMGLVIGRMISQALTLVLQFLLSGEKIRFGFDRALAPSVLSFGLPVAGANLLSLALLNVDNVTISRMAGPMILGFYFLAFNVSNWPMSALGQVVRSVSLPAFSRVSIGRSDPGFGTMLGPVWAVGLLGGLMLAVLSAPMILVVYGAEWLPAASVLAWLGLFGALRTVFDLAASYLLARGASGTILIIQVAWIVVLVPAMVAGTALGGIEGAGIAHLAVAIVVVLPAYALALARSGADLRLAGRRFWPPLLAAIPAGLIAGAAVAWLPDPLIGILCGGLAGCAAYFLLSGRWLVRGVRAVTEWSRDGSLEEHSEGPPPAKPASGRGDQTASVRNRTGDEA